jgi:hypothetical protein
MRTRLTMLAAALAGLALTAGPGLAVAAPRHNQGLTINATPRRILSGQGVLIYGQLNGTNVADQTITLYHRINPRPGFTKVQSTTTDANGFYEFARGDGIVTTNREWFVRGPDGTHSRTVHERVAALLSLGAAQTTGTTNHRVIFTGSVSPAQRFRRVLLQQQDRVGGNGWHTIASTFTGRGSDFVFAHAFRRPGVYTLRAYFSGDARNAAGESDSVTVTIQQAQIKGFTITSSEPVITEGRSVTISGVVDQPNTQVTLYVQQYGHPREALATTITGGDGSYHFSDTPVYNTVYRVGLTLHPHRMSGRLFEGVQDKVSIQSSASTATVGSSVTITGAVSPDKTGHLIYLQQLGADGRWQDVARSVVIHGSTYSFTYTFGQAGAAALRARIYGGPENVGGASSPVTVTVSGTAPAATLPPAS